MGGLHFMMVTLRKCVRVKVNFNSDNACILKRIIRRRSTVVTVNEYLASRDAREMGELYNFLGLSVG